MLVLSRKVGERILIGDQIAVTIVRITGGGVRVGIEAPPEMAVLRAEIKAALEENPSATEFHSPTPSPNSSVPNDLPGVRLAESTELANSSHSSARKPR